MSTTTHTSQPRRNNNDKDDNDVCVCVWVCVCVRCACFQGTALLATRKTCLREKKKKRTNKPTLNVSEENRQNMSLTMSSPSIRMNRNTPLKSYSKGLTPSKPVVFNDLENENPAMPAKGFGSTKKVSVAFSPNVKSGRKALSNLTPNSKVKYSEVAGEVVKKLSNQLSQRLELEPVKETTKECGECAEKEAKYKQIQAELINVQEDAKQYQDQYTKIQGEGAR